MITELDVAKKIASGELKSGIKFGDMYLFALRITGTGAAYRHKDEEFVWRDPALYMTDEFVARCAGLPVIVEHPAKRALDTDEYRARTVGAIMFAWQKPELGEIWGIARIQDFEAAELMNDEQLSTSPGVVFSTSSDNNTVELDDGSPLLIEGEPTVLSHLAICREGVWDKLEAPAGVISNTKVEGEAMSDESLNKSGDDLHNHILTALEALGKSMNARMDSIEARFDSKKDDDGDAVACDTKEDKPSEELEVVDKKKADDDKEEEKEEEKEEKKSDSKKKYDDDEIKKRMDSLEAAMKADDDDDDAKADAQAKADSVYSAFGSRAPRSLRGESLSAYRTRLLNGLKKHSAEWSNVNIAKLDSAVLDIAEAKIYADSMEAAMRPVDLPAGQLREIIKADATGRRISEFVGSPADCWDSFKGVVQISKGLNTQNRGF